MVLLKRRLRGQDNSEKRTEALAAVRRKGLIGVRGPFCLFVRLFPPRFVCISLCVLQPQFSLTPRISLRRSLTRCQSDEVEDIDESMNMEIALLCALQLGVRCNAVRASLSGAVAVSCFVSLCLSLSHGNVSSLSCAVAVSLSASLARPPFV
jgi:hypothetical protein